MSGFRVLVTGSRTWRSPEEIYAALDALLADHPALQVVHGACSQGADAIADRWAIRNWVSVERHPARWAQQGRGAGFIRNLEMVAAGADVCLAFMDRCRKRGCREPGLHGSHGAVHCADRAESAGIRVDYFRAWETGRRTGDAA